MVAYSSHCLEVKGYSPANATVTREDNTDFFAVTLQVLPKTGEENEIYGTSLHLT